MILLKKEWCFCVFIVFPGLVSPALAEDTPDQQVQSAGVAAPEPAPALPASDVSTTQNNRDEACTICHGEYSANPAQALPLYQTKHGVRADSRAPNCQSCHGESDKHQHADASEDKRPPPDVIFGTKRSSTAFYIPNDATVQNDACLSCHRKDANRSHWEGSTHQSRDVACASCHEIHTAHDKVRDKRTQPEVCFTCHKEQRTQISRASHHPIPEGKMACSDCHNPHGSIGPKLMKRDSVNETCYTCHMEKRGPFVHEHEPVSEDCTICHNPHGTTAESMLKMRPPFLCQSCHSPHSPIQPSLTGQTTPSLNSLGWWDGAAITQGRGCMNCHTQIHGSNNPSSANPPPQNLFR